MASTKLRRIYSISAVLAVGLISSWTNTSSADVTPISWQLRVQDALDEAKKTGKPLFVSVSTDWCHYCAKMDRETLSDVEVSTHIQKCFVPLKIDGDANRELVRLLGVQSFPTTLIMTPNMEVLQTMNGFRSAVQLDVALERICESQEHQQQPPRANTKFVRTTKQVSATLDIAGEDQERSGEPETPNDTKRDRSVCPFGKHCPVSSFEEKHLIQGNSEHTISYRGFEVYFASAEAMRRFEAQPHRYWPMLDGHCMVTALETGLLRPGSWNHGVSYADRVWFLAGKEEVQKFSEQPRSYLSRLIKVIQSSPSPDSDD